MKVSTIRNILIGLYILLVLGFSAIAKADVVENTKASLNEVSPFSR